jgi:dedicated sortase system histidine kinase
MSQPKSGFRLTLRAKLVLVSLTLLLVPWIGYRYLIAVEDYLRQGREGVLLERARTLAALLSQRPELFARHESEQQSVAPHLFVRPVRTPVQLDGYPDEWNLYKDRLQSHGAKHVLFAQGEYREASLSFQLQWGSYKGDVYALFRVTDDTLVYRDPRSERFDDSDHLELDIEDGDGKVVSYVLATSSPGWVGAYAIAPDDDGAPRVDPHIKAEWQETEEGYNIELRIPRSSMGARMAFRVVDVDDDLQRAIANIVGVGSAHGAEHLSTVGVAAPQIQNLLRGLTPPATRTWVVDAGRRVIAMEGRLKQRIDDAPDAAASADEQDGNGDVSTHALYRLLLRQPAEEFQDDLSTVSSLSGAEIEAALQGEAATRWRQTPDLRVSILTAAIAVREGDRIVGAVAVEETNNGILLLQNRALETLINVSVGGFVIVFGVLIAFATRLSLRVRRLRDGAELAIGPDGRVRDVTIAGDANDEIGDLARSFGQMLERLSQYNRYLESMAGKLSHELRTPVSVVRSSLENLETRTADAEQQLYLQRAREGIERLGGLLARMSEATRLEQSLQGEQSVRFDMEAVVRGCVDGYRAVHPAETFEFNCTRARPGPGFAVNGSAELIAQALDKLVSNALDFHRPQTPIVVTLHRGDDTIVLSVGNTGPNLPEEMRGRLFDSMVSVRSEKSGEPHLGLGLYIVRLIADFHRARVEAVNRAGGDGVEVRIISPAAS